jgi:hypothetical protein
MEWASHSRRDHTRAVATRRGQHSAVSGEKPKPVYVPLPPDVAESLRTLPPGVRSNPRYFFWSGNGHPKPKSAGADWQRSYRRVFELAGLKTPDGTRKRCFPHMFRDTFAVEMLLAGVPLEQVSILLGHKSVKIKPGRNNWRRPSERPGVGISPSLRVRGTASLQRVDRKAEFTRLLLRDISADLQDALGVGAAEEVTFVQQSAEAYRLSRRGPLPKRPRNTFATASAQPTRRCVN